MQSESGKRTNMFVIIAIAVAVSSVTAFVAGYLVAPDSEAAPVDDNAGAKAIVVTDEWGNIISMTLEDDYNRTVVLDGVAERIVSVAPTPTELIFAVGAGDHVVGRDDYSDYPAEALDLPSVGSSASAG